MILAVEIENSKINFGIFDEKENAVFDFCIEANIRKTPDEYALLVSEMFKFHSFDSEKISGVAVASVVPQLTDVVIAALNKAIKETHTVVLGRGSRTGFPIRVENPAELGADIVANAAAVLSILKKENSTAPAVIVDMGTASTVFVLNDKGELIGGSILPGVDMSFVALHGQTAQLPNVSPMPPTRVVGKNSHESVRSGVIFGNAILIDGFVEKIKKELNVQKDLRVFITGEFAQTVLPYCESKMQYAPLLTLEGLACIYKNNA